MPRGNNVNYRKLTRAYMNTAVDPGSIASLNDQAANLYGGYRDSLSLLKLDRQRLKTAFRAQRGDIRTQRREDVQSAIGAANDRGVLGSSSDVDARASIQANAASQVVMARDAKTQGIQSNLAQAMQARRDFFAGMAGLAAQRAAMKGGAGIDAFLKGILDGQVGGGGGRGGRGGRGGGGGGQETYGPNDLTRSQITNRLGNISPRIKELLAAAQAAQTPAAAEATMAELREEWERRNKLRRWLGRKTLSLDDKLNPPQTSSRPAVSGGGPVA